jgi:hypothetical protein
MSNHETCTKGLTVLFSFLSILWIFTYCEKNKTTSAPDDEEVPVGTLVDAGSCKTGLVKSIADTISTSQDCIHYEYDGTGTLSLEHINTGFNCCPDTIMAEIDIQENQIHIVEKEGMGLCNCLCLFDLTYEITHVQPAIYHLTVSQMYLAEPDSSFDFTIDLRQSASGQHCLYRSGYPWGI